MAFRDSLILYCADVGSIQAGNFGWARGSGDGVKEHGRTISNLADSIADDLTARRPVALGFECPLFVPVRDEPKRLTSARDGEGNRAWSASGGMGSLVPGLVETIWVLRVLNEKLGEPLPRTFMYMEWDAFVADGAGLYLWEAFVTGDAKGAADGPLAHAEDAAIAVRSFLAALPEPENHNAISEETVHSLIGAALLRTGWSDDISLLSAPCLVIRS